MKPPKRRNSPPPAADPNELWQRALSAMQAGRYSDAEQAAELVGKRFPGKPEVQHLIALAQFRQAKVGEALQRMAHIIRSEGAGPAAWQDYGNMLREAGQTAEAESAYRRCLSAAPKHLDAWENLTTLLLDQDRCDDAIHTVAEAHAEGVHSAVLWLLRGTAEQRSEAWDRAADSYRNALEIDPKDAESHRALTAALRRSGKTDEAAEAAARWLHHYPDDPVARHMVAALKGDNTPQRADDAYITRVFDAFAESFDEKLADLNYKAPQITGEFAASRIGDKPCRRMLDAGCGTGLCGPYLRPLTSRLVGADLSTGMLAKARLTGLYDELIEAELTVYLQQQTELFDWIVSADTLNYFGELMPLFAAAHRSLVPDGRFLFTLEDGDVLMDSSEEFRLQPNGRYVHRAAAVASKLDDSGFEVVQLNGIILRIEAGKPVHGHLVFAVRV